MRHIAFVLMLGSLMACQKGEEAKAPSDATAAADTQRGEPAGEPTPAPEAKVEEPALVNGTTVLKKEPSDDRRIEVNGKKVSNWLATLYRGEEVVVLGKEGDFTKARTSDETEGWIKSDRLVRAADVELATVAEEAKVWRRPDVVALDANKTIAPGSLLFVLKKKDQFAEVDYPRSEYSSSTAWVMADKLITEANEVSAAKLIMKIRYLREKKDASATQLTEIARSQFGSSQLIGLLDQSAAEGDEGDDMPEDEDGDTPDEFEAREDAAERQALGGEEKVAADTN